MIVFIISVLLLFVVGFIIKSSMRYKCPKCGTKMNTKSDPENGDEIYECPKCGNSFRIIG